MLRPANCHRHSDHFLILLHKGCAFGKQTAPKIYGADCFSVGPLKGFSAEDVSAVSCPRSSNRKGQRTGVSENLALSSKCSPAQHYCISDFLFSCVDGQIHIKYVYFLIQLSGQICKVNRLPISANPNITVQHLSMRKHTEECNEQTLGEGTGGREICYKTPLCWTRECWLAGAWSSHSSSTMVLILENWAQNLLRWPRWKPITIRSKSF